MDLSKGIFGTFANSVNPDQIPFNLSQPFFTGNVKESTDQFNTPKQVEVPMRLLKLYHAKGTPHH